MESLKKIMSKYPEKVSPNSEWLKLAIKEEGKGVQGTGPHLLKLLRGELAKKENYTTKKEEQGIMLFFEEGGKEKKYFIPMLDKEGKFHYLFEKFANIEEGEELILEYKKKDKSFKGFIDVKKKGEVLKTVSSDEIPIIEEENYEGDFGDIEE